MATSWTGPLTVRGREVPVHGTDRYDNRFSHTAAAASVVTVRDGNLSLSVSTTWGRRRASRLGH